VNRSASLLAAFAALIGAAGVALGAAGAHLPGGGDFTRLGSIFLILHAGAALAIASFARLAYFSRALLAVGLLMLAGSAVFAADLAHHDFLAGPLFPYAAPTGGTAMIVAWLLGAIVFFVESSRRH
jgi:uncharacterized membrane protein YgdD (TMEM256/DUF423 family)